LLCDVMGWSASETAHLLGGSIASVNSALQRARATLAKRYPDGRPLTPLSINERQRALLERYQQTWENGNLDGFVDLLRQEAIYSMPPWRHWYRGRDAIRAFFAFAWGFYHSFRLVATGVNRQPAFAVYSRTQAGATWQAHSIQLLELDDDAIVSLTMFVRPLGPELFTSFGLPAVYAEDAAQQALSNTGPLRVVASVGSTARARAH
jgi:RNA polymerase sigma-70 factor (ECF subfamily)